MNLMRTNRLPWLLSGALGASLSLAPALVRSSSRAGTPNNRPRPRASRVTGVRQARRPMRKMDRSPRRKPRRRTPNQDPNQGADQGPPQYPGQAPDQAPSQYPNQAPPTACPRPQEWATDSPRGLPISLDRTNPMVTTATRLRPQGVAQTAPPSGPVTYDQGHAAGYPHQ